MVKTFDTSGSGDDVELSKIHHQLQLAMYGRCPQKHSKG